MPPSKRPPEADLFARGPSRNPQEEAEGRIAAARRYGASELNLAGLQLTALPDTITDLRLLRRLRVGHNLLTELPASLGELTRLEHLDASKNQLASLPAGLSGLTALQTLDLADNRLKTLPEIFQGMSSLESLYLHNNRLTSLPESLGQLTNLRSLFAQNNQLRALPKSLQQLTGLQALYLHENPGLNLPPEVLGSKPSESRLKAATPANPAGILDYFFSKQVSRPLNEAKMILVGRGGVGKTSLVNRLVNGRHNPKEGKTDGIAITQWPIRIGNDQISLNIWDFGGQEIMHATHQFFLTKRSLYLLVLNAREGEQDANVEYWLRLIESFGGNSPVLLVLNKIKDHHLDLNRRGLQAKYPAIHGFIETDCEQGVGIEELRSAILRETDRLEHLRDPFPASWFQVKDRLTDLPKLQGTQFISFARYQQLCAESSVTEATSQDTLLSFLHDLGIVVNFRDDPRLAETHVLNPEWVTNGIYKILNAGSLARKAGELRLGELAEILEEREYPQRMHLYLLDLMRKFELCYEFYESAGAYLVPELLGKEEPELKEFQAADALRFEYLYNILPEGLLPRFVVRSRALNRELPRWRTGIVLAWDGNRAMVKADVQDRRVAIVVTGPLSGRRRLLAVIRADLEHIHKSIPKLQVTEQVPIPGHPGLALSYESLRVYEAAGEKLVPLVEAGKLVKVNIQELLNGIEETSVKASAPMPEQAPKRSVLVTFSYSHKDRELRDELETHLKLLKRQDLISTWYDRQIMPGDKWEGVIDDNFKRADIILLLVSANFLASDYCYEIELQVALERAAKGDAKVVPIVLRACDWASAPFGSLQGLPKEGRPIASWRDRSEAWASVAKDIRKMVESLRARVD